MQKKREEVRARQDEKIRDCLIADAKTEEALTEDVRKAIIEELETNGIESRASRKKRFPF